MGGPVLVADSGGTPGDNLDFVENILMGDVNVGDDGKTTTQTNTSNNQVVEPGLEFDFLEVPEDVEFDFLPHVVVGFLHFAVATSMLVFDLGKF